MSPSCLHVLASPSPGLIAVVVFLSHALSPSGFIVRGFLAWRAHFTNPRGAFLVCYETHTLTSGYYCLFLATQENILYTIYRCIGEESSQDTFFSAHIFLSQVSGDSDGRWR